MALNFLAFIQPVTDAINSIVESINRPITQREEIRQKAETSRVQLTQSAKTVRTLIIAAGGIFSVWLITLIFRRT
jgi:hypothetical protein